VKKPELVVKVVTLTTTAPDATTARLHDVTAMHSIISTKVVRKGRRTVCIFCHYDILS